MYTSVYNIIFNGHYCCTSLYRYHMWNISIFWGKNTQFGVAILDLVNKMISYSIFPISIVFCTLKNPQNDTKIIILPLLVKKLWNGLKRMAAILFLCKWGQKVLVGHASMSEMICMTINYYHAKLNNSTQKCRVQYILDRLHGPLLDELINWITVNGRYVQNLSLIKHYRPGNKSTIVYTG